MPEPAIWPLFFVVALQGYAAWALIWSGSNNVARGAFSISFILNGIASAGQLAGLLNFHHPVFGATDEAASAVLVIAAEGAATLIGGGRFNLVALPVAGLVALGPSFARLFDVTPTASFTLMAYGYVVIRVAGARRLAPDSDRADWAVWVLLAFAPRVVEFLAFLRPPPLLVSPAGALFAVGAVFLVVAALALLGVAIAERRTARGLAMAAMLCVGLILSSLWSFGEPFVMLFSLGVIRPATFLAGIVVARLLGAELSSVTVRRHALVIGPSIALFFSAATYGGALFLAPSSNLVLAVAFVVVLSVTPVLGFLAERVFPSAAPAVARVRPPVAPGPPTMNSLSDPTDSDTLPPGLDPACKFDHTNLAFYAAARSRVADLDPVVRDRLARLTRNQRLLLALAGSDSGSLGRYEFSQAGVQLATHIPYKNIAAVVRAVNAGAKHALVSSSTGLRGTRYYRLTGPGQREAEAVAKAVGVEVASARYMIGEAFLPPPGGGVRSRRHSQDARSGASTSEGPGSEA